MTRKALLVALVVLCLGSCLAFADTLIDTTTGGWSSIGTFGYAPFTETYGQTVAVPVTGQLLESFTFEMRQDTADIFRGEVYKWNGTQAVGPSLWESAPRHTTDPSVYQPIEFDTGGLPLPPGYYVLFASTVKDPGSSGGGDWGYVSQGAYDFGNFVWLFNTSPSEWTTAIWMQAPTSDLAFKADFSQVPEPGTMALLAMGLVGIVAKRRKK